MYVPRVAEVSLWASHSRRGATPLMAEKKIETKNLSVNHRGKRMEELQFP